MLSNPTFWVAVGLVIFLALLARAGVHNKLLAGLDQRSGRIQAELDEARRLRDDANALLKSYEARRAGAEAEAAEIVARATELAKKTAEEAAAKLNDFIARRTAQAQDRIAQAETQALNEVRAIATDRAIAASETVLRANAAGQSGDAIVSAGLNEAKVRLNS